WTAPCEDSPRPLVYRGPIRNVDRGQPVATGEVRWDVHTHSSPATAFDRPAQRKKLLSKRMPQSAGSASKDDRLLHLATAPQFSAARYGAALSGSALEIAYAETRLTKAVWYGFSAQDAAPKSGPEHLERGELLYPGPVTILRSRSGARQG